VVEGSFQAVTEATKQRQTTRKATISVESVEDRWLCVRHRAAGSHHWHRAHLGQNRAILSRYPAPQVGCRRTRLHLIILWKQRVSPRELQHRPVDPLDATLRSVVTVAPVFGLCPSTLRRTFASTVPYAWWRGSGRWPCACSHATFFFETV
jgi:hypothetical protein